MEEWEYSGASAVPSDIAIAQKEKWFNDIKFEGILEFLDRVKETGKA